VVVVAALVAVVVLVTCGAAALKRPGIRDCSGYWVIGSGAGLV